MAGPWLPALEMRSLGEGRHATTVAFPASSPWFDGHFPGKPILPGLGLLALVLHAVRSGLDQEALRLERVIKTRFKGVILPGDELDVSFHATPAGTDGAGLQVRFQVERKDEEVGTGRLVLSRRR